MIPTYECVTPEELAHLKNGSSLAFERLAAQATPLTADGRAWFEAELMRIEVQLRRNFERGIEDQIANLLASTPPEEEGL